MSDAALWLLLLGAFAVTYAWRGLGVVLGGRIRLDGPLFRWVAAVAYAMLAGLIARMIVLPLGPLAETPLAYRLLAAGVALAAFFLTRRNTLLGVAAGAAALVLLMLATPGGLP